MCARDAQEERCFARCDEADAMAQDDFTELKLRPRHLRDYFQLMLRHRPMRFVFDPGNGATVFPAAHDPPKIHYRAG